MKLEDQVCSFELAKQLKEFGVKQDSYFVYTMSENTNISIIPHDELDGMYAFKWAAFTVAELGEMLPLGRLAASSKDESGWYMWYVQVVAPLEKWREMYPCKNEADARAKMLIYLIENKLIEVPK